MPSPRHSRAPHNIYLLHALAHVELNAVDLAFDTMLRFIPQNTAERDEWFRDWTSIAEDEARHYEWLCGRMNAQGWKYGDLPAHGIIWKGAKDSEDCVVRRLALGQLVAEARGLDASPRIAGKLVGMGDKESGKVVGKIAEEEVRHVQVGVKWYLRRVQGDGIKTFQEIALKYANGGSFNGGFNHEKRREAGLTPEWYEPVERMMKERNQAERENKIKMEEEAERKYRIEANKRTRERNDELFRRRALERNKANNEAAATGGDAMEG